jgi:hypothetical protein
MWKPTLKWTVSKRDSGGEPIEYLAHIDSWGEPTDPCFLISVEKDYSTGYWFWWIHPASGSMNVCDIIKFRNIDKCKVFAERHLKKCITEIACKLAEVE